MANKLNNENVETTDTSNETNNETNDSGVVDPIDAKFAELENKFNNSINRAIKQLKKSIQPTETSPTVETSSTPESVKKEPADITLNALRSDYEKSIAELKQQIEDEKSERMKEKRLSFTSKIDSQIATMIAKKGFDDVDTAITVFKSMHSTDNYHQGDGVIVYKKNEDDDGTTLESLIETWSKSSVGKRFYNISLPNGGGAKEPPTTPRGNESKKPLSYKQLREELASGKKVLSTDY